MIKKCAQVLAITGLLLLSACGHTRTTELVETIPNFCQTAKTFAQIKNEYWKQQLENDLQEKFQTNTKFLYCRELIGQNKGYAVLNHEAYSNEVLVVEVEEITFFIKTSSSWTPVNHIILFTEIYVPEKLTPKKQPVYINDNGENK